MRTVELNNENKKKQYFEYWKIPEEANEEVIHLADPHIDSFNFFLDEGLSSVVQNIPPLEFALLNGDKISIFIQDIEIGKPQVPKAHADTVDTNVYPKECIESGSTYKAVLRGTLSWTVNERVQDPFTNNMGEIPIMVKSKKCNLYGMNTAELVRHGELRNETGGYFIVNGGCRVLRMLIANRRNYPIALIRKSWKMRDNNISEKGIFIRCVSQDETSTYNILHHMTTGGVKLEVQMDRELNYVLIHLETVKQKFDFLCMMTRKLFSFVSNECATETVDVVSMQEMSLGGHVYLQLMRQKLIDSLNVLKNNILIKARQTAEMKSCFGRSFYIGNAFQSFIATGTLPVKSKCGLMQKTGLTVMMERLNRMRDLSHLRACHRGAFFLDMKTIGPRRLTGEAWGFICPVHTPDGAPCGLLNHLAHKCKIPCESSHWNRRTLLNALLDLGMIPVDMTPSRPYNECLEVVVDGSFVGYITKKEAKKFELKLREKKVSKKIYEYTEIVLIEETTKGQYPALFLFTSPARMMRPVINVKLNAKEYVGTFEQLFMNVAISLKDFEDWPNTEFSHCEIEKNSMLSNIGKLVPFSDCNPNPRNMYQCQMGKQTMGTPLHNWLNQTNHKIYRLQYPQIPLVRNKHYDDIEMEEFCMGFNAVVAIVSYTGYDMEDAMVINKCAMERGLGHGQVYKSEFVDLTVSKGRGKFSVAEVSKIFQRDPSKSLLPKFLDEFGLPYPGTKLTSGDPYYCVYDLDQDKYTTVIYKGEDCVVDKYSIIDLPKAQVLQKVNITIRIRRDPIIGDKFASRSGQKGVMSRLYPMEDLPFSERGITPDIIFNPHGIPSRMTAGTLIDLVAGKCGAEFGKAFDSSPFHFDDENPPFDYFGKLLEKAGFNYYGEDVLYSGTDGRMMEVEIFEGIIYYQRLRHMTADKWQVRSTGAMDTVTHQPIKGRKRGGAIRFGEMERDCLISHGAAYTLKDRLLDCSDITTEFVCSTCGSSISPTAKMVNQKNYNKNMGCSVCGPEAEIRRVEVPYAFKFFVSELSSVGIKTKLGVKGAEQIIEEGLGSNTIIKNVKQEVS
ncbi:DNA-directed RNA polymerase I subunit RPA2 [Armadillidium nasatum]|uniref:DNA-directed RNA polymerase subunit beta n=1 Tax=Armadillidium nasatum TaxID=96803 RepID=A0A5N5SKD2_9CRUS|nr:DNA-directed RNA polymerase I subunit RPA2 [Armadillidium nasatum]